MAKICFLFIAQPHQVLHSLPIALALRRGWPAHEVEVVATTQAQIDYVAELVERLGEAPLAARLLGPAWMRGLRLNGSSLPPKAAMLAANLATFARYDAVVAPERTTTLIRRMGVRRPMLVYTQHGAGDRSGTLEPRIGLFDLVMAAGPKTRDQILENRLAHPENVVMVGYPKFDLVEALPRRAPVLFEQARPTVIYNPHFDASISSWPAQGLAILEAFAADPRYNLLFAPHVRLFDQTHPDRAQVEHLGRSPNIYVSLAGPEMIDMTYVRMADVYLGDVSSQIYEFLREPRPCVFINGQRRAWRGDPAYRNWLFGPVVQTAAEVLDAVDRSRADHDAVYRGEQLLGLAETFDLTGPETSSERAARAIVERLERRQRR